MFTKTKLVKKLQNKTYWNTKESSTEKDIRLIIENWLRNNPENIQTYLNNSEFIYKRCKGAFDGRKLDLANKKQ